MVDLGRTLADYLGAFFCGSKKVITNYYTLRALVKEWGPQLQGTIFGDAYSQAKNELTLAFSSPQKTWMIRIGLAAPFQYIFRYEGYNRARRNVTTRFEQVFDTSVSEISLADRDRVMYIAFEDKRYLQISLFGPRANVFLVDQENTIVEAFLKDRRLAGQPVSASRPAPADPSLQTFIDTWPYQKNTTLQALSRAFPFFDKTLAAEAIYRSELGDQASQVHDPEILRTLYHIAENMTAQLREPLARIYWQKDRAIQFATLPLDHVQDARTETFHTIDEGIRVFVRKRLSQTRFEAAYKPLAKTLQAAADHYEKSLQRMLEAMSKGSRADLHESYGHLLMSLPAPNEQPESNTLTTADILSDGSDIQIPVDPQKTIVQNAQHYYERARNARQAREHAESRLISTEQMEQEAKRLLTELTTIHSIDDLKAFKQREEKALAGFIQVKGNNDNAFPFRRFFLDAGYEVWVGKNARQNDKLTFQAARKFDRWMHARGVAGSHAILRVPGRTVSPPPAILEKAASIAAYFSKARGSELVPVIITECKYVRKAKGALPGAVLVDRETVIIVPPALPQSV